MRQRKEVQVKDRCGIAKRHQRYCENSKRIRYIGTTQINTVRTQIYNVLATVKENKIRLKFPCKKYRKVY